MTMWVLTGVLVRFPDLKVVFVEPGVGWIAWWLYLVDDLADLSSSASAAPAR